MRRSIFKLCRAILIDSSPFLKRQFHAVIWPNAQKVMELSSIPGPTPLPLIGNVWRYFPIIGEYDPIRRHRNYEKMHEIYGDVVLEVIAGNNACVHLFDPNDMEKMYRNEGRYPYRVSHRALEKYRVERKETYNSGGIISSNGEEWHRLRKAFQPYFLNKLHFDTYIPTMEHICEDMIKIIKNTRNSNGDIKGFQKYVKNWAVECTGALVLNRRLGSIGKGFSTGEEVECLISAVSDTHYAVMITENDTSLWNIYPTAAYRRLVKAQNIMAQIVKSYIDAADRYIAYEGESLLEKFRGTPNIDEKDIFCMIIDAFLGGIETNSSAIVFTFYCLAKNPQCQEALHEELRKLLPRKTSEITEETFNSAHYLKACVKETMRMKPLVLGAGRLIQNDLVLSNYRIPSNTSVFAQHQVACVQPQNFTDPLTFRPERWLCEERKKYHPVLVMPFGNGARMCLGKHFVNLNTYTLLAKVFRNFRVECHNGEMDCYTRLINVPDRPLNARFVDVNW